MWEGVKAEDMSDQRPKRDSMSFEEATISNMWEIGAIVEILERKGLCTEQDLYDIITKLRKKNPRAKIPETAFPEPYLLTETENKIIDDVLALLNKNGLTAHRSKNLLERLGGIIEMGQRVAKGTTYQSSIRGRRRKRSHETTGSHLSCSCQTLFPL